MSKSIAMDAFSARAGARYGALGFALAFLALPLYIVLPAHYAQQHALSLTALGLLLMACRLLDAGFDPWIGRFVDRWFAVSSNRAWRIAALSAGLLAAGFCGLFFPQVEGGAIWLWLTLCLLVTYAAFSVLAVVHQAWGARLGGRAQMRARVVAWREGFGLAGVLVAAVAPSQWGLGVTCLLLVIALCLGMGLLAGAPQTQAQAVGAVVPPLTDWALPWRQPAFRGLIAVFVINGVASAVPATLVLFFVRDGLEAQAWEAAFLAGYFGAAVLSLPLWVRLVRLVGLEHAWLVGMLLSVLAFGWAWTLGSGAIAGFALVCAASGAALGADLTVPAALLTGVLRSAGHHGQAEGLYFGWWNSATKLNLGLAAGVALPLLGLAGYAPGLRDEAALQALRLAYVLIPCGLKLLAAFLLWRWWRLNKVLQ